MSERLGKLAITIAVVAVLVSIASAAYLSYGLLGLEERLSSLEGSIVKVHVYIDYGNGTVESHDVVLTRGLTALDALRSVADVEVKMLPELGAYIVSINGVRESYEDNKFWIWYIRSDGDWELAPVGAGGYVPKREVSIMFRYQAPPW